MTRRDSIWKICRAANACVLAMLILRGADAATVWTGPEITWSKSSGTPDTIVPGKVVLTRGINGPLYNTAAGERSASRSTSPKGVTFAFGTIDKLPALTSFKSLHSLVGAHPHLADAILNVPIVAHITDGDIYFSITFTEWGQHFDGGVTYTRSTPSAVVPPTVTITSPAEGATFTAPANIPLTATASGGTITGVSFFNGTTLLGTVATEPYTFTVSNLPAGSYQFTAVASTADTSATSGVVHVTVTTPLPPPDVTLSNPSVVNGTFSFAYSTEPGHTYVIESASASTASGSLNWAPVSTNTPSRSFATYSESVVSTEPRLFRVGQLP
jgi:hypothetical protein